VNFTEHLKAEIFIPHNIFQEIEEGETLSHSYQETNATLIFLMITDTKSSTKYLEIKASKEYKDIRHHHEVRLIPGIVAAGKTSGFQEDKGSIYWAHVSQPRINAIWIGGA